MDRTVRAFAPLGLSSLAFTRLDEAFGYGEMFNLARTWGVPLSFFSVGQEIPEDLERASRERVVERIFGL
jgi:flagellar biosynthesis protein FlhF